MVEDKKKKKAPDDFFGIDKSTLSLGASALSLLIGVGLAAPQISAFLRNLSQMNQTQTQQQQPQLPPTPPPEIESPTQQQPEETDTSALETGQPTVEKKRGYVEEVDPFGQKIRVPVLKKGGSLQDDDLNRLNVAPG